MSLQQLSQETHGDKGPHPCLHPSHIWQADGNVDSDHFIYEVTGALWKPTQGRALPIGDEEAGHSTTTGGKL